MHASDEQRITEIRTDHVLDGRFTQSGKPADFDMCRECGEGWPCDAIWLLDALAESRAREAALVEALEKEERCHAVQLEIGNDLYQCGFCTVTYRGREAHQHDDDCWFSVLNLAQHQQSASASTP